MKKLFLLFIFLMFPCFIISQERQKTKIAKILDSNLFLSSEGQLIKLANVESPSILSENSRFARRVLLYAKEKILNHSLYYEAKKNNERTDTLNVHLFEKFMLTTVCFNKEYLRYGYGKFISSADSTYSVIYMEAEKDAKESGNGLWKSNIPSFNSIQLCFSGNSVFEDKYSRSSFLNIKFEKISRRYQTQFSLFEYFEKGESSDLFIQLKFDWLSKYFGVKFGATYFSFGDHGGPQVFIFPVFGLKAGYMEKIYLSCNFCEDIWMGFFDVGLNYHFSYPYGKIVIGAAGYYDNWFKTINLQFKPFDTVFIDLRGKYNFDRDFGSFLGGIGFLF
ncbi:hypothetical protein ACFL4T_07480 [candidate division KSB1 bacterium]